MSSTSRSWRSAGRASPISPPRPTSTSTATAAAGSSSRRAPRRSSYDALVEIDPEPEPTPGPDDAQHRIEDLPDHLLHWLLPSRYAESDLLNDTAWELFGETEPGAERALAVTGWIHENIEYGVAEPADHLDRRDLRAARRDVP